MSIKRLVPLNTVSLTADPSNAVAGDIYYNSTSSQLRYFNGTSWVILAGSVNALVDAKSIYQDVRNQSGTSMAVATPVYVSGSLGASNKILISTASNASEATSSKTMGITTSSISDNSNGQVISEGLLEGIDTTGAADGDPVWLGVNGAKIYGLLNKPSAPAHLVFLGIVVRGGSATTGSMYVKIQNGFELQEIHNVEISSLINGNILAYDSTTQTWKNTNTLQSTSSTTPLVVKATNSPSVNIFEVQNSSGYPMVFVDAYGALKAQASGMYVNSGYASGTGLVVRGYASQTADLQQWQNSAGTVLVRLQSDGTISSNTSIYAPFYQPAGGGGSYLSMTSGSPVTAITLSASVVPFIVKAAASQTADLQQWQKSDGTVIVRFDAYGSMYGFNNAVYGNAYGDVLGRATYYTAPATIGVVIRGAASQTANLQEWQNSSGTVNAFVTVGGFLGTNSDIRGLTGGIFGGITKLSSAGLTVYATAAGNPGAIIRGAASQSANLQEWQNSAGTLLASISSAGSAWFKIGARVSGNYGGSQALLVQNDQNIIGLTIKANTTQTANLTEWQDSTGTVLANIDANGQGAFKSTTLTASSSGGSALTLVAASGQTAPLLIAPGGTQINSSGNYLITPGLTVNYVSNFHAGASNVTPIYIRGAASQTANLQEWQDSAGANLALMTSGGFLHGTGFRIKQNANSTISSAQGSIEIQGSTVRGLVIVAAASQTADLQQWQDSAGTVLTRINSAGNVYTSGYLTAGVQSPTGTLTVVSKGVSVPVAVIKGAASQTANLQEWQDSTGTALLRVNAAGQIQAPQPASKGLVVKAATTLTATITNAVGSGTTVTYTAANTFTAGQTVTVTGVDPVEYNLSSVTIATADSTTFTVTNAATGTYVSGGTATVAQTANLTEWQDSAGTMIARITNLGGLYVNSNISQSSSGRTFLGGTADHNAFLNVSIPTASRQGVVIRANASQTANLQEWQNSSGSVLSYISAAGSIFAGSSGTRLSGVNGDLVAIAASATVVPIISKGFASQTANLTQWQDSSGSVLSRVQADGTFVWGSASSALQNSSGRLIINLGSAASVGITVKGAASQTANLQEWQNSAGTVLAKVNSYGDFYSTGGRIFRGSTDLGANLNILNEFGSKGIVVRQESGGTANLQEWQNSSGTVLAKVDASGIGTFAQGLFAGGAATIDGGGGATLSAIYTGALKNSATAYNFFSNVTGSPYATVVVKGLSDQTTDLQQWQNSAGTVLVKIAVDGTTTFSGGYTSINQYGEILTTGSRPLGIGGTQFTNTVVSIQPTQASLVGIAVRGAASQTANLTEWQNNAGTVLTSVDKDGYLQTPRLVITNGGNIIDSAGTTPYFGFGSNQIAIYARNAAYKPLIIQGAASQTANLQEWQNDTGTVLASIWSSGTFVTSGRVAIGNGSTGAKLDVMPASSTQIGVTIKSNASQTANLLEFQNSSGTALTYFNSSGGLTATEGVISTLYSGGKMTTGTLGYFNATTFNASVSPVVIRGAASQSTHYIQVQNSNGTLLWGLNSSGESSTRTTTKFGANIQNDSNNNNTALSLSAPSTSGSGIALNVYSGSTTRDMARFDNSGVVKLTITSDGSFKGGNSSTISANTATTVDTVALSSFTTIEYTISIKQGSKIRSSKVLVHTDGTSVDSTEYGIMEMGGGITGILVLASVSSTDSILQITIADATTTNATVKLIKTML